MAGKFELRRRRQLGTGRRGVAGKFELDADVNEARGGVARLASLNWQTHVTN